jgi:hypothetical protein
VVWYMCYGQIVIGCKEYILTNKYFKLRNSFCVLEGISRLAGKRVLGSLISCLLSPKKKSKPKKVSGTVQQVTVQNP